MKNKILLSIAGLTAAFLAFGASAASGSTPANVVKLPTVSGVSATWATQEGFLVSWATPSSNDSKITGYTVTSSNGAVCAVSGFASNECVFRSSNVPFAFKPYLRYTFTVTANSATSVGPVSAPSNAAGWFGAPDYPGFVAAKTVTDNEVDLKWIPAASTGGVPLTSYKVYYWPLSDDHAQKLQSVSSNSVAITGLTKSTWYVFAVQSCNYYGCSTGDWVYQATTPAAASTSKSLLPVVLNGGSASTTCWDAMLDGGTVSSATAAYKKAVAACPAAVAPTSWPAVDPTASSSPNLPIANKFNAKTRFSIASSSYSMAYKWNDNNLEGGAFTYSRSSAPKMYLSSTPSVCSVLQKNGTSVLHFNGAGLCAVTLSIPTDATYLATAPITSSFTVRP